MNELQQFNKLSVLLTGFDKLPAHVNDIYLKAIKMADGYKECMPRLLELSTQATSTEELIRLVSDEEKACCKGITFLWYTAELLPWSSVISNILSKVREPASEETYYSTLLWQAIRAHPPALSGGYFGHWKYEPEN